MVPLISDINTFQNAVKTQTLYLFHRTLLGIIMIMMTGIMWWVLETSPYFPQSYFTRSLINPP